MNKRAFVTCVLAGEAAAIALTLANTYVPGKLIDALVYGGDLENILLLRGVLVGSFLSVIPWSGMRLFWPGKELSLANLSKGSLRGRLWKPL